MTTVHMNINRGRVSQVAALLASLALSGCSVLPQDLGRSDVDTLTSERGQPVSSGDVSLLVDALAKEPLTAESAVKLALMNNPSLQASYVELGFGAADVYAASRIRNPVFSATVLDPNRMGELDQLTFGLVGSFTDLLTLSSRKRLARAEFAALKESIGAQVLATAADADAAYYHYVGAKQVAALRAQIAKAGGLSEALAKRYYDAGNISSNELALEQAAGAEARLSALSAEADAYSRRTELANVLGLSVGTKWDASSKLPVPLADEDELSSLLTLARQRRLDLAAARIRADILADQLGVVGWTRLLGELDIGYERERDTDGARLKGPTLDWELPIFNQHRDALMRADAHLQLAILEVAKLTLEIDNEVHLAYAATQNAKARVTTFRDQLIPARMAATARSQEEENYMLIGIFEVLATKQQEYDAYQGYMESVRDYWLSRAALTRAVGTTLPSTASIGKEHLDLEEILKPKGGGGHSGHDMSMSGDREGDHSGHSMAMPEPGSGDHSGHNMPMAQPKTGGHSGYDMTMPKPKTDEHSGHDMTMPQPKTDEHSGHDMSMPKPKTDKHSEHDMSMPKPKIGEHAGHDMTMPKPKKDEHSGHDMTMPQPKTDEHSGHDMTMPQPKTDEHSGHDMTMPQPKTDEHAGHDMSTPNQPQDKQSSKGDRQ